MTNTPLDLPPERRIEIATAMAERWIGRLSLYLRYENEEQWSRLKRSVEAEILAFAHIIMTDPALTPESVSDAERKLLNPNQE